MVNKKISITKLRNIRYNMALGLLKNENKAIAYNISIWSLNKITQAKAELCKNEF